MVSHQQRNLCQTAIWRSLSALLIVCTGVIQPPLPCPACDFCDAIGRTIGSEIAEASCVLVVKALPRSADNSVGNSQPRFEIVRRFKVGPNIDVDVQLASLSRSRTIEGRTYFLLGYGDPKVQWKTPKELRQASIDYLDRLAEAPLKGADRLAFFLPYLTSKEAFVSDDAHNEFAEASFDDVRELGSRIDRSVVLRQIQDPQAPARLRRLSFALLSVAGRPEDVETVRDHLRRRDKELLLALDAGIACYLSLTGPSGLAFVRQEFLENAGSSAGELHAVVKAIRFHGEAEKIVPREQLAESLTLLLTNGTATDQVLADLARWEYWKSLPKVIQLIDSVDKRDLKTRTAAVMFLMACPEPLAKRTLDELARTDPKLLENIRLRSIPLRPSAAPDE